jgi:hypothetical protein
MNTNVLANECQLDHAVGHYGSRHSIGPLVVVGPMTTSADSTLSRHCREPCPSIRLSYRQRLSPFRRSVKPDSRIATRTR